MMGLVRSVRYFENILIEYFNKTKFITTDLIKQIKLILRKYINQDSVASMQLQEVGKHPPKKKPRRIKTEIAEVRAYILGSI